MRQCPRCASEITLNDKVCPRCGLPVNKMNFSEEELNSNSGENFEENSPKLSKKEENKQRKLEKIERKKQKKLKEQKSDTDFSVYATNSESGEKVDDVSADDSYKSKRKKYKEEQLKPKFQIDENGEFDIDTKDVEIVGEEIGKLYEEKQTYSVKKARGDYRPPKIKWWEIYKLADRSFARRKINREISKASKIKPSFINKTKLLLLAIFFGWTGAHNFYAKNKKKGWVSLISLIIWIGVFYLGTINKFFASIRLSVSGCAGFICLMIWFSDIINIIFNNFKYRIQKEAFIFNMNIETRAKLGEKYIDEELYYKPWYVRFNVWCKKKKRDYDEWKHDRRQRMIQKEKEKIARAEEKEKIDAEIRDFEEKEEKQETQKRENIKKQIEKDNIVNEIAKFDGAVENEDNSKKKTPPKAKKAKITVKGKKNNKK